MCKGVRVVVLVHVSAAGLGITPVKYLKVNEGKFVTIETCTIWGSQW